MSASLNMKCDIILPVCDQYDFTKNCIESIIKNTDTPYRLIIINNGKNPDTRKLLNELGKNRNIETTIIHNDYNIGWVKALNKGMEMSTAPYLCFQNDDTIVTKGWARRMIEILNTHPKFGLINPEWEGRAPNVSIDSYDERLQKKYADNPYVETDWCRGFSVILKREVMEKIGKVDEIYGLAYFDDVDYSVTAIEAGFICLKANNTYVYHHRNVTFFQVLKGGKWNELHEKNKLIYYKKWGRPLKISIILDKEFSRPENYNAIKNTVLYLARKQHRVYLWTPNGDIKKRISHTNVVIKTYPALFQDLLAAVDVFFNSRKKETKKYNGVFASSPRLADGLKDMVKDELKVFTTDDKNVFFALVKGQADILKEKSKEL